MKRLNPLCLGLLLCAAARAETVRHTFFFDQPEIHPRGGYHEVTLPGTVTFGLEGEPELPLRSARILLPPEQRVSKVRVYPGMKHDIHGKYRVKPGGRQMSSASCCDGDETPIDWQIYSSGQPYPAKCYSSPGVQRVRGYEIAVITLYPVEYIPAEGRLSWWSSMKVEFELEPEIKGYPQQTYGRIKPRFRGFEKDRERVKALVDNREEFEKLHRRYLEVFAYGNNPVGPSPMPPGLKGGGGDSPDPDFDPPEIITDAEYVIITSDEFSEYRGENSWYDLLRHKESRGISTALVSTSSICAHFDGTRPDGGTDRMTRIRNFITAAYNWWGTEYVLLGGDSDGGPGGEGIVPHRRLAAYGKSPDDTDGWDREIPGDIYYACLDGSYNFSFSDRDYGCPDDGEGGGPPDLFSEVYVGRAPVDSIEEMQNFVHKTIAYENSTGGYLHRAALVGERMGFYRGEDPWRCGTTYGKPFLEELRYQTWLFRPPGGFLPVFHRAYGFSSCPFLETGTLYEQESGREGWPQEQLVNLINSGVHLIAHQGHASNMSLMKLRADELTSDPDLLENTDAFFVYSSGCWPAAFDNLEEGTWGEFGPDCIAEELVTCGNGAFAVVGNARFGFWSTEDTRTTSQYCAREFWDALFGENITNLGRILQDSKEDNIWLAEGFDRGLYILYGLNLLGDPETPLKVQSEKASVRFDRDAYKPGESAVIWLSDLNLPPGTLSIDVRVKSTSMPEGTAVTLHPSGVRPSLFKGAMLLDGSVLPVNDGDALLVEYTDPDTGGGAAEMIQSASEIDARAPDVIHLEMEERATSCTVTVYTDELAQVMAHCTTYSEETGTSEFKTACLPYMAREHVLVITGLRPRAYCELELELRDAIGNERRRVVGRTFTTPENAPLLVVDDDGLVDEPSSFEAALDALGLDYDVWDALALMNTRYPPLPSAEDLFPYPVVLWDCGTGIPFCLARAPQASEYLDRGGRFLLAGYRILDPLSDDRFRIDYLHVDAASWEDHNEEVVGIPGDPITSGLTIGIADRGFGPQCQSIRPWGGAVSIFTVDSTFLDSGGLRYADGVYGYRTVVLPFAYSSIPEDAEHPNTRANLMRRIVDWLRE